MDQAHQAARRRLFEDPDRLSRYVATIAERLLKSESEAFDWIEQMFEENRRELIDAVAEGFLIDCGRLYWPDP